VLPLIREIPVIVGICSICPLVFVEKPLTANPMGVELRIKYIQTP